MQDKTRVKGQTLYMESISIRTNNGLWEKYLEKLSLEKRFDASKKLEDVSAT